MTPRFGLHRATAARSRPVNSTLGVSPVDATGAARLAVIIASQYRGPSLFLHRGGRFERQTAARERLQEWTSAGLASASGLAFATSPTDSRSRHILALAAQALPLRGDEGIELTSRLAGSVADFDLDGRE